LLLATVGALAWFVPWVGMLIAVLAVGLMSLPTLVQVREPTAAITFIAGAVYTLVVLSVLEMYVEPRLFNRRRYNSLLIAVVVIGMAEIIGVAGIILGPPLAAALQILLSHVTRRRATGVVSEGARPNESLKLRAEKVEARIAHLENPAPELVNLAERMTKLVDEAEQLVSSRAAESALADGESRPSDAGANTASG
jgi:hypothetical protein